MNKDDVLRMAGEPAAWLITGSRIFENTVVLKEEWADNRIYERGKNDQSIKAPLYTEARLLAMYAAGAAVGSDELLQKIMADMLADGWRQCAKGQHTSQFCGQLEVEKAKAYAVGAADMRERAVDKAYDDGARNPIDRMRERIRALPITPTNTVPCPNAAHMGEYACTNKAQCYEPCGDLGHSEEHCTPTNMEGEQG